MNTHGFKEVYKPRNRTVVFSQADCNMAVHLTRSKRKSFKKCCIYTAMDGTDDMLWNGSEEDEDTDCEDEAVSLTGKGAQNVTCFVYQVYESNSKIFFLSSFFFLKVILESSCIQVKYGNNMSGSWEVCASSHVLISSTILPECFRMTKS